MMLPCAEIDALLMAVNDALEFADEGKPENGYTAEAPLLRDYTDITSNWRQSRGFWVVNNYSSEGPQLTTWGPSTARAVWIGVVQSGGLAAVAFRKKPITALMNPFPSPAYPARETDGGVALAGRALEVVAISAILDQQSTALAVAAGRLGLGWSSG